MTSAAQMFMRIATDLNDRGVRVEDIDRIEIDREDRGEWFATILAVYLLDFNEGQAPLEYEALKKKGKEG